MIETLTRLGRRERALTVIEVLLILVVIFVLAGLFLPTGHAPRSRRIKCVNNLKNVGLAFRIFATDNEDRFPMELPLARRGTKEMIDDPTLVWIHFAAVSNGLSTPKLLLCPDDKAGRIEATTFDRAFRDKQTHVFSQNANLSYFVGLQATERNPTMLLAGDRNLTNDGPAPFGYGIARVGNLGTNHTGRNGAAWDGNVHRGAGDVALGDGSVKLLSTSALREQLRNSGNTNNRVAIPD